MFSHESVPLIIIFIIMLLGVLTAILHPVHAFITRVRRRRDRSSTETIKEMDTR